MRSVSDRIRHVLSFKITGLALIIPARRVAFHMPMHYIGVAGLVSATVATAWNFVYN